MMSRFLSRSISAASKKHSTILGDSTRSNLSLIVNLNSNNTIQNSSRGFATHVGLQLDYYMSAQFAGVACALADDLYADNGLAVDFLPICPVGEETKRVRNYFDTHNKSRAVVGSVEQNIFVPQLYRNPSLDLQAVASIFRRSPLCLASLVNCAQTDKKEVVIGAHEDTVELLERIVAQEANTKVIASPRASKNTDLANGGLGAIQAYTTTEVPALQRAHGQENVHVQPLEGWNGCKLGYSQMLFVPSEVLQSEEHRETVQNFLQATFHGWERAIRDPESAVKAIREARAMSGLDDEDNDHWDMNSPDYELEFVKRCSDYVKETFQGDKYGVISSKRFNEASDWLLQPDTAQRKDVPENFGLDTTSLWQPSSQLMGGSELARRTLEDVKISAQSFEKQYGRKPSFAVISVGDDPRYTHGERRVELYSNQENSWFRKTNVGKAHGFDAKEINMPSSTTTEELLSVIYSLSDKDGIQLMWPMPDHIDSRKVYNAIPLEKDIDGAHYIGTKELMNNHDAATSDSILPPVTPAAVIALLEDHKIQLANKEVLVVGRSRIVGSPVAHMLREKDAVVTVVHSRTDSSLVQQRAGSADLIISCAGEVDLLPISWIKPGADVVIVGTTFDPEKDSLVSDVKGDLASVASRYTPVPGGIGPLSMPMLLRNVQAAAWNRMNTTGTVDNTWTRVSGALKKTAHFSDYTKALAFASQVNELSSELDHHANMTFSHQCVDGVDLEMEFFTYESNSVTDKDYLAASKVDQLLEAQAEGKGIELEPIFMNDYTYDLKLESIAKYPANPRGSSKMVRVDEHGEVSHFDNFEESFYGLAKGAHVVFNESKVANARVSVIGEGAGSDGGLPLEMMILDIGNQMYAPAKALRINVMLRQEGVQVGDLFTTEKDESIKVQFHVVEVIGPWIEDEHSNGNGTEVIVECIIDHDDLSLTDLLDTVGTVPIPPYLDREAEDSDAVGYNNVFATSAGSVAAPTAGLHFTDSLLNKIGSDNLSFLSLHVGAGTFKPVVVENAHDHAMHGETFSVNVGELRRITEALESDRRLIVVGTTSSRTLESLYWIGVKKIAGIGNEEFELGQKEWMELMEIAKGIAPEAALKAVMHGLKDTDSLSGRTHLMITPHQYTFQVVDELVTNFHAPDSTLMLLVSAFLQSGSKVKAVYEDAQDRGYKFLSFGDVCFFSKPRK